jgi:hypothetical protein
LHSRLRWLLHREEAKPTSNFGQISIGQSFF